MEKWIIGEMNWMRIPKWLALIYCILTILAFAFSDHLIFQPPKPGYKITAPYMLQLAHPPYSGHTGMQKTSTIYVNASSIFNRGAMAFWPTITLDMDTAIAN